MHLPKCTQLSTRNKLDTRAWMEYPETCTREHTPTTHLSYLTEETALPSAASWSGLPPIRREDAAKLTGRGAELRDSTTVPIHGALGNK